MLRSAHAPIFEISLTVSSGTYVRSIIHDIALALSTTAHVVKLTRTRQGKFTLHPPPTSTVEEVGDLKLDTFGGGCVEWSLLEQAITDLKDGKLVRSAEEKKEGEEGEADGDEGLFDWEREILSKCKEV